MCSTSKCEGTRKNHTALVGPYTKGWFRRTIWAEFEDKGRFSKEETLRKDIKDWKETGQDEVESRLKRLYH